jgi:hypothetical protein
VHGLSLGANGIIKVPRARQETWQDNKALNGTARDDSGHTVAARFKGCSKGSLNKDFEQHGRASREVERVRATKTAATDYSNSKVMKLRSL